MPVIAAVKISTESIVLCDFYLFCAYYFIAVLNN